MDFRTIQLANVKFLDDVAVCDSQDRSRELRKGYYIITFSDVFRGQRKGALGTNGLINSPDGNNFRLKTLFKVARTVLLASTLMRETRESTLLQTITKALKELVSRLMDHHHPYWQLSFVHVKASKNVLCFSHLNSYCMMVNKGYCEMQCKSF